ncbi:hypothetical protein QBC40DRAFT_95336 [Triangularia verruculosa]|uniref:Uncharacterized protein n=1 Tax=Triangularia verruculosa TaxID=2587418 RepID=A0AAN6XI91_9PEZI|nr:hypothetical protein QBC40DRAFT_95336 [Triangularia verruculosa]
MGWLFRRKSRWKRAHPKASDIEQSRGRAESALPPRTQTFPDAMISAFPPMSERQGIKKQRTEPKKLQRRARTYSFSPGRDDSIQVGRSKSSNNKRGAGAPLFTTSAAANDEPVPDIGLEAATEEILRRVPTLHNKRDGDHLPRKKSSKKQKREVDHQREAEIKAMSSFVPVRPAAEDWMGGRPMKKESRRVKSGLGFVRGSDWEKRNRSSEISLPAPESISSALSSDSDFMSFRVSALEALAPRPTLRCTTHPRVGSEKGLIRKPSQRQNEHRKTPANIPEATLKAHKRVANLADDLNASDLRELMERDQRRRERKRQLEQEKIEARLARRAEKQQAAEAAAQEQGRESPPNLERGVLGREILDSGVSATSAIVTSTRIRDSSPELSQETQPEHPGISHHDTANDEPRVPPLAAFHRVNSIPLQAPELPQVSKEEPLSPLTSPRSRSSFLYARLRRSKSPLASETRTEHTESIKKDSETSNTKSPLSWATFFRWGKNKRHSTGPSSFSNTSRDSMQIAQIPTPPPNFIPRQVSSGVPKRTMSRFREDLPESPLSPPDSRIQSPEVEVIPPIAEMSPDLPQPDAEVDQLPTPPAERYDTPMTDPRSLEDMRETPSTVNHPDEPAGASPEPHAMSLASIDSEASWFGGGALAKKRKSSSVIKRGSHSQLQRYTPESDSGRFLDNDHANEEMAITEDDYLARLTPLQSERPGWKRKSTGEARPSSDWEEEAHWGNVGQQPTLVHAHTVGRMKSREGFLNTFGEETASIHETEVVGAESPVDEGNGLQRATSINLGKGHVRHISAGSARLLSITPRSSMDGRRTSLTLKRMSS